MDDVVVQLTEQKTMEFIYGKMTHVFNKEVLLELFYCYLPLNLCFAENVLDHATYTDPLLHNVVKIFHGCSDKSKCRKTRAEWVQYRAGGFMLP